MWFVKKAHLFLWGFALSTVDANSFLIFRWYSFNFGKIVPSEICAACVSTFTCHVVKFWYHDEVIKWKHFPRYSSFVRGIHRSPVNSPYKGQRRGALVFPLNCVWINGWVNSREAGDLRPYRTHCDVTVMFHFFPHTIHFHSLVPWVCVMGHITWFQHMLYILSIPTLSIIVNWTV